MSDFSFDTPIDRRNTDSVKFDDYRKYGIPKDALPLWVADMDFPSPPCVLDALRLANEFGVFGYTFSSNRFRETVCQWFQTNHRWNASPEWIVQTPNVMFAVVQAMRIMTAPGDAVMIQQPVYPPFPHAVTCNDRRLVVNELQWHNGQYTIDFDDFEQAIIRENVRLFILCSPHNPVGRVWTREELTRLGTICLRHNVFVVSDEIHADLVYPNHCHTVFASLNQEFANHCIICTAPTKTFNLPGLQVANIFIPNEQRRTRFADECLKVFYYGAGLPGLRAAEAAYRDGRPWLDSLVSYLAKNAEYVKASFAECDVPISFPPLEGTYLMWLDCRALELSDDKLHRLFTEKARLWLSPGTEFGQGGNGFMRLNIATSRSTLIEFTHRLLPILNHFSASDEKNPSRVSPF